MTIQQTRASAASFATLRTRVRAAVGDRDTSTANQRWSDTDIDQAINDTLFEMYAELGSDPSSFLVSDTFTYSAGERSAALNQEAQSAPIYRIEDATNSDFPTPLTRVDAHEIESSNARLESVWCRADGDVMVRPIPGSDLTLRVWYIGNPFSVTGGTGDQHPYPVAHEELIVLGAAIRLQEEDEEIPASRPARYIDLWSKFQKYAMLYRGPRAFKQARRFF